MKRKKEIEKENISFTNKVSIFFGKIQNQRHIASINDTFATLVPLLIIGSFGILLSSFVFGGSDSGRYSLMGLICYISVNSWDKVIVLMSDTNSNWYKVSNVLSVIFGEIQTGTIGFISIYVSFLYAFYLGKAKKFENPYIVGVISLASFLFSITGEVDVFLDVKGLFSALIVGTISTEFYIFIERKVSINFGIKPFDQNENKIINQSFKLIVPLTLTILFIGALNLVFIVPALTFWKSLSITQTDYGWNKTDLWTSAFKDFLGKSQQGQEINDSFLTYLNANFNLDYNTDYDKIFTNKPFNNNFISLLNSFGKGQSDSVWLENIKLQLTPKAYKAFMLYMFTTIDYSSQNGFNINSIKDIDNLDVIENIWTDSSGVKEFFVSLSYNEVLISGESFGLSAGIYKLIGSLFFYLSDSKGIISVAFLYVLLISILWFFGIHGSNVIASIFEPIWIVAGINNMNQYIIGRDMNSSINPSISVFTKTFFDIYVNIGGAGGTLAFVVASLLFSKRKETRKVSKFSVLPGFMNINEPILFGTPIILNYIYLIPFIASPLASLIIGWIATGPLAIVNAPYITIPWTMPWFVGAFLATRDIYASILSIFIFIVSIFIWVPFVFFDNKVYMKKLKETNPEKYEDLYRMSKDKEYRERRLLEIKKEKLFKREKVKEELEEIRFQNRVKKLDKKNKKFILKATTDLENKKNKDNKKSSSKDED